MEQLPLFNLPHRAWYDGAFPFNRVVHAFCVQQNLLERTLSDWLAGRRAWYLSAKQGPAGRRTALNHFWFADLRVRAFLRRQDVSKKDNGRTASLVWVNLRLSEDDKVIIQEERPEVEYVLSQFAAMVYEGYRLSVAWDDYSKAVQASLICGVSEHQNAGHAVSSRHPDLDMCLTSLLYKVQKMGDEPWSSWVTAKPVASWD